MTRACALLARGRHALFSSESTFWRAHGISSRVSSRMTALVNWSRWLDCSSKACGVTRIGKGAWQIVRRNSAPRSCHTMNATLRTFCYSLPPLASSSATRLRMLSISRLSISPSIKSRTQKNRRVPFLPRRAMNCHGETMTSRGKTRLDKIRTRKERLFLLLLLFLPHPSCLLFLPL